MRGREARTSFWVIALTAVVVGISALFVFSAVPALIARAYRGESIGLINRIIEGRSEHPVDFYLSAWNDLGTGVLAAELVLGLLVAAASWPPVQRFADARVGPLPIGSDVQSRWAMGRARVVLASAVILLLAGAQLLDVALQTEHWPFSRYNMYSASQTRTMSWLQIAGVTPEGEVPLDVNQYFRPFDSARLVVAFDSVVLAGADSRSRAELALKNLYALYERGRRSGSHDGPSLSMLRLYRVQWRLDPGLANTSRPDQKTLLYERAVP